MIPCFSTTSSRSSLHVVWASRLWCGVKLGCRNAESTIQRTVTPGSRWRRCWQLNTTPAPPALPPVVINAINLKVKQFNTTYVPIPPPASPIFPLTHSFPFFRILLSPLLPSSSSSLVSSPSLSRNQNCDTQVTSKWSIIDKYLLYFYAALFSDIIPARITSAAWAMAVWVFSELMTASMMARPWKCGVPSAGDAALLPANMSALQYGTSTL